MNNFNIEMVAAGGALVISAGSFFYLSNKIEEISTKLEAVTKNSMIQIGKLAQHDDDIKISTSKIKDIEHISKELSELNKFVKDLSDKLEGDFEKVSDIFSKHDAQIESLSSKIDVICDSLDIKFGKEKEKHVNKRKKRIGKRIAQEIDIKKEPQKEIDMKKENIVESNDVNILSEMENILGL